MDCWDDSRSFTPAAPGQYFLPALEDSKIVSKMPVDPINNTVNGNVYSYFYFYDNSGCKCNIDDTALCISNGGNPDFAKRAYLIISNYESPHNSHGDDSCELFDSTFPNGYYIKLP